jgi:hypothetical protein
MFVCHVDIGLSHLNRSCREIFEHRDKWPWPDPRPLRQNDHLFEETSGSLMMIAIGRKLFNRRKLSIFAGFSSRQLLPFGEFILIAVAIIFIRSLSNTDLISTTPETASPFLATIIQFHATGHNAVIIGHKIIF